MVDKIWYNMEELIGGSEERVLIETYWNVKAMEIKATDGSLCINRNILECKELLDSLPPPNRIYVLIETYWNVKFDSFASVGAEITEY